MTAEAMMWKLAGLGRLEMRNEAAYELGAPSPSMPYSREYRFQTEYHPSSCHGVIYSTDSDAGASVLLCSAGGATGVHERSLCLLEDRCFVAVGPYIVSLSLPGLDLLWAREVDSITCFGIHPTLDGQALISHGELQVARVSLSGKILWTAGGADIFTGKLHVTETHVRVEDFSHRVYLFDLETGRSVELDEP